MEQLFKIFLILHIVGGGLGLLAGTYVMVARKGDARHKLVGNVFMVAMLVSAFCSLFLSNIHPNPFLFTVGIFTIYLTGTGRRYLSLRNIPQGQKPLWIDWALTVFMVVFGVFFIWQGVNTLLIGSYFGLVPIVFAVIGLRFAQTDYKIYKGNITTKNYWMTTHLQRMIAAYIASLTAFLVVNVHGGYGIFSVIPWLLPTLVLVPLIFKWTRKYKVPNTPPQ